MRLNTTSLVSIMFSINISSNNKVYLKCKPAWVTRWELHLISYKVLKVLYFRVNNYSKINRNFYFIWNILFEQNGSNWFSLIWTNCRIFVILKVPPRLQREHFIFVWSGWIHCFHKLIVYYVFLTQIFWITLKICF